MNSKSPILIINGEPHSVFIELLIKSFKKLKNLDRPIILICSNDIIKKHSKKFNFKFNINIVNKNYSNFKKKKINLINIDYNRFNFSNKKISSYSNTYVQKSFDIALTLIKKKNIKCILNGPISKRTFLKGKFRGITEYLAKKTKTKDPVMLIYNKYLSVSPLTTHIPINKVDREIKKNTIINKVKTINIWHSKLFKKRPKIAILGINPHNGELRKGSEEQRIIIPAIKKLQELGIFLKGPFGADTIFINDYKKYDVIIGMYHDQVLTPFKTLYKFNAINLTLGLNYTRVSPDHGIAADKILQKKSDPESLLKCIKYIHKFGK